MSKKESGHTQEGVLFVFCFIGLGLTGVTPFLALSPQLRFHKRRFHKIGCYFSARPSGLHSPSEIRCLKRAIENLENLSERPSSRGDLKKESVSLSCSALIVSTILIEKESLPNDQVIMRLRLD